jgi:hypothetical protein
MNKIIAVTTTMSIMVLPKNLKTEYSPMIKLLEFELLNENAK